MIERADYTIECGICKWQYQPVILHGYPQVKCERCGSWDKQGILQVEK